MAMPGRSFSSDKYRYGFNGKELDNEVVQYDYGFRIYDPRLGRFKSVDPLTKSYPWNSTYAFAENNPIRFIDLDGLEKANPEMFELALEMIKHFQALNTKGTMTKIIGLEVEMLLEQLKDQMEFALKNGASNAKTNIMGYYCGKSAVHNDIIMYNPMAYIAFMYDLATTGSAKFGGDGLKVKIPDEFITKGLSESVPAVDEIFGKSVDRSTTKKSFTRKIINLFSNKLKDEGNSIPFEFKRVMSAVGLKSSYSSFYKNYKEKHLQKIEKAVGQGLLPIVFQDNSLSSGAASGKEGKFGIHFIVITKFEIKGNDVHYTFWHYGRAPIDKVLSIKEFAKGMRGLWIPKKEK